TKLQVQMDTDTKHEVLALLQMGAHFGNTTSVRTLGQLSGVAQNYAEARQWYNLAVEYGDANAMVDLGLLYRDGLGVPRDYDVARRGFMRAADAPDHDARASAMLNLGLLDLVTQDYAKAREWYEKAAGMGNAAAMTALGGLYYNGHGVVKDYAKAREW